MDEDIARWLALGVAVLLLPVLYEVLGLAIRAFQRAPLHDAASSGDIDMLKTLLAQQQDLGEPHPRSGYTPLQIAIMNEQIDAACLLLQAGAAPWHTTKDALPAPLNLITKHLNADDRLRFLHAVSSAKEEPGMADSPLHLAAAAGDSENIDRLLAEGTPIDSMDGGGYTPLMSAVIFESVDGARTLLNGGAAIDSTAGSQGTAPIHIAADRKKHGREFVELLVEHGAFVDQKRKDGSTPLHDAAERGLPETVVALLDAGADIDAQKLKSGDTPLHIAIDSRQPDIVELLVKRGADVNVANLRGLPPLALCNRLLEKEQSSDFSVPSTIKEYRRIAELLGT